MIAFNSPVVYDLSVPAKSGTGFSTPTKLGAAAPLAIGAFFMPLSMVGCVKQPQGWPVPSSGSANFTQSATIFCLAPESADSNITRSSL